MATTVHLIANAHIDPIWLWPWQAGLDSALATLRSACDRLDKHPDLYFTRNEAWIYAQVERIDPALFNRIRKHVASGRWHIVGGWWIQPDCNQPSGFALRQQIEIGRRYFMDRFGVFPKTGYNVDTFGHTAALPGLMREFGQSRYIFMRPQEHEMKLPGRVFRWRGYEHGPEVAAFRISRQYCCHQITKELLDAALSELPPGIQHTMLFFGVGDHGGGPTERQIAWLRENWNAFDGVKFEFSNPDRFFDAISDQIPQLPLVTGELQHHAVGCYTVQHPMKASLRKAEHLVRQAEIVVGLDPRPEPGTAQKLDDAWKQVCFHHFHDTLGGTCIPSAYEQVHAQLGMARAIADDLIQSGTRRPLTALPDDKRQRIIVFNASDEVYDGYVLFEPWLDWAQWKPSWRLIDGSGANVAYQLTGSEATTNGLTRIAFRATLKPGERQAFHIDTSAPVIEPAKIVHGDARELANASGIGVKFDQQLTFGAHSLSFPRLELIEDKTDTWSHGIDRFAGALVATAKWDAPERADTGPLFNASVVRGSIGASPVTADYRVFHDDRYVELLLNVTWTEKHKLLKLTLPLPPGVTAQRVDGISGGQLPRPNSGKEVPLRDWTLLDLGHGVSAGVVCPDAYALDCTPERLRITLLRSPLMAHHDPHPGIAARYKVSDQGEHEFRFRFFCARDLTAAELERHALMLQRPVVCADLTRGMPA